VVTGQLAYYETLKAEFPPGIFEMFSINTMGPKKIQTVWQKLGSPQDPTAEQLAAITSRQGLEEFEGERTLTVDGDVSLEVALPLPSASLLILEPTT